MTFGPQHDRAGGQPFELVLALPAEVVEAIACAVVAKLQPRLPHQEGGEPWRLWKIEETGRRLGRSVRWVRERVSRGDLPSVRLDGGAFAFEPEDVRAFAASRRVSRNVQDADVPQRLQGGGRDRT